MADDPRVFFVGDVKRFEVTNITKDGTPWALTAVTLILVKPNGTVLTKTASLIDSVTWGYTTSSGDLDVSGPWRRYWLLTDGSSPNKYGEFSFFVRAAI